MNSVTPSWRPASTDTMLASAPFAIAGGSLLFFAALAHASPTAPPGYVVEAWATSEVDPYHLAFDAEGDLWVGHDTGTVTELRADGSRVVVVSGLPDPDSVFADDEGLLAACGGLVGDVLVGNFGELRVYSPVGALRTVIGGGANLQGFTVDGFGRLLFADLNNRRLSTVDASCTQQPVATLGSAFPGDVVANGDVLYVTDLFGSRNVLVLQLDAFGAVASTVAVTGFADPEGIAFDPRRGRVFVAERSVGGSDSVISSFDTTALVREPFAAGFGDLRDVQVGPDGCLYASDAGLDTIWRICEPVTDEDADGVEDPADACPATQPGDAVDGDGCSGAQRVDLTCGTAADHRTRGQCVSCVAHAAQASVDAGLLTPSARAEIVRDAARSRCR